MDVKKIIFILLVSLDFVIYAHPHLSSLGPDHKSLKFGVLVNNENYLIYRSKKLGTKGLSKLHKYLYSEDLLKPKTIIYMNKHGYKIPFLFALDEYYLQEDYGFNFYHSFGLHRTYLDGHDPYMPKDDIDREDKLGSEAQDLFDLLDDGLDGDVDDLVRILELVLNPDNQPVLFHCFGGRHRTGIVAMVLRYIQGGWWINGETKKKKGLQLNPAEYEYYKFNHLMFRKENILFVRQFSKDIRFIELKERYQGLLQ
jgi:hypothetical protein